MAQEAFLRVFKSLERFDFQHEFSTWLYRIVTNLSIDLLRKRRPHMSTAAVGAEDEDFEFDLPDHHGEQPDEPLEREETAGRVRACIDALAPHFRVVMALRELEGLPCTEIARIVGATHVTVRWRLHRGRKLFQEEWERRERVGALPPEFDGFTEGDGRRTKVRQQSVRSPRRASPRFLMTDRYASCADVLEQLPLFVGADLDDETALRVVEHLERCEPCRLAEGQAAAARARLVETFEEEVRGGGPNLWAGIRTGLVKEGLIEGAPAPLLAGPWRRAAAVAVAAAVLAIVLVPFLGNGPSEDPTLGIVKSDPEVEMHIDSSGARGGDPSAAGSSGGLVPREAGDFLSEQIPPNGLDPHHDLASSPIR